MCSGLLVAGITQVTSGSASMYLRNNCAQLVRSISRARPGRLARVCGGTARPARTAGLMMTAIPCAAAVGSNSVSGRASPANSRVGRSRCPARRRERARARAERCGVMGDADIICRRAPPSRRSSPRSSTGCRVWLPERRGLMPRNRSLSLNLTRQPDADNQPRHRGIDTACPASITAIKTRAVASSALRRDTSLVHKAG